MNFDKAINRINTHSDKWDMMEEIYGVAPTKRAHQCGSPIWILNHPLKLATLYH